MNTSAQRSVVIAVFFGMWGLGYAADSDPPITRIALGSCARQNQPQPIWEPIVAARPDLFLFLGDNIYGDSKDVSVLKAKYSQLADKPGFKKLRATCPILATWDDHDYGADDAGTEYPMKVGVFFVSGDVHRGEISAMDGGVGYPLYDLAASGLTHTAGVKYEDWPNRHRIGTLDWTTSFGVIEFEWNRKDPLIRLQIRDDDGDLCLQKKVPLSELQPEPAQKTGMSFRIHEIGRPTGNGFGQTSAVDVDQDGDLDFISGRQFGDVFWFENQGADKWVQHLIGEKAKTDVGGVSFDVDGDGWIDQVSGGTWFRNPGNPRAAARWERFENGATPTHDNLAADIDGDGKLDLVSILDKAGVFWYRIPPDPTKHWIEHKMFGVTQPQCHGGIAVGDIDGDGDLDVSRVDRWLENADGKGETWIERKTFDFGKEGPWGIQTRAVLVDVDRDGDLDLIQAEGDVLDGRVAWFENLHGNGKDWERHLIKEPGHNQDFHSVCVADFDNDGDVDVFSGGGPLTVGEHQWFLWENAAGNGGSWNEHLIQRGQRTHESVCGDVDGDGDIDILTKPWRGDLHLFIENLHIVTPSRKE